MSREARTLLVIAVLAILGVSSLGYLAHRYGKIAKQRQPALKQAQVDVDAFIQVRRVMRETIDSATPATLDHSLKTARERAIAEAGIDPARYEEIRQGYREWRGGRLVRGNPLAVALEKRREQLGALDLGDYELLDF